MRIKGLIPASDMYEVMLKFQNGTQRYTNFGFIP